MKKAILFMWFGDEKPPYIQWTLENFRRMNPGWEVRYIEYSTSQIMDYKQTDDPILTHVREKFPKFCEGEWNTPVNFVSDRYRWKYLEEHKDEFVIYCDLDCFPIAPFDNFILGQDAKVDKWIKNNHPLEYAQPRLMGNNWFRQGGYQELMNDIWCMSNNKAMLSGNRGFLQLHKGSVMDDTLVIHNAMLMNESKIPEFKERSKNFHEMKIEFGDNFCLPQFTPIEHYYSFERNKLNKKEMSS